MSKAIKILSLSMVALILVMAFNFTMGFIDVTYATTAVGQLKGDSAYYMMETQREVALIVELIFGFFFIGLSFIGFKILKK